MTITGAEEAYEAMRSHHRVLGEQLSARAAAVSEAVTAGRPHEAAVVEVIAYLAEEVLPHAAAEEGTIYPAAAAHDGLIGTVNEMLAEHHTLAQAADALAELGDGRTAAEQARQAAKLFATHADRENDVLLPALLADDSVDLPALLGRMHRRAEETAAGAPVMNTPGRDLPGALLGLLLEGMSALAQAGQADLACRLTAAAWTLLRQDRPALGVTVTTALHGLARRLDGSTAQAGPQGSGSAGQPGEPELDVRGLPPARRHETIFTTYQDLTAGTGFILVNDHDPKPLRYQFAAEYAGEFTWDYLEAGPTTWRVRIGRAGI